jgi:cold shock CspA family protein
LRTVKLVARPPVLAHQLASAHHYFRGRLRAQDAEQKGALLRERVFDEVLVREGVVTHYLPLGPEGEKGIDVWLALEAYELAIYKRFDVSVLIACDGDFLPLVRKLNTVGTRVMLLAWDFKWTDHNDQERETRTAQVLLDEVSYPVMMYQIIDDRSRRNDRLITNFFVPHKELRAAFPVAPITSQPVQSPTATSGATEGSIKVLKDGYIFITPSDGGLNMFFFHSEVLNADFNELRQGLKVRYRVGNNAKGPCAVQVEVVAGSSGQEREIANIGTCSS